MYREEAKALAERLYNSDKDQTALVIKTLMDQQGADVPYRTVASWISKLKTADKHPALAKECEDVGIDIEKVSNYWYKGKAFSIHARGNRDEPMNMEDIVDDLIVKIGKHAPIYKHNIPIPADDAHLLVIDIADAHFGKLASAYETGEDYNIKIAKQRVIEGFFGIYRKAQAFKIEKVLLVIGNDVLHFDGPRSSTTKGTFQDSDVMFYDMFNIALETYVELIEGLMEEVDIDVIYNPSNHDYVGGWMLARTLEAWFRNSLNVTFQTNMSHRKYYQYGTNMIGTSHGDGAKMADTPLLMANEAPVMWSETQYRYIYLHHYHSKQRNNFLSGKDYIGVTVEYLRSPSSADSWHKINGFSGAKKAIEGFLHHKEHGQVGRLSHYF